MSDNSNSNGNRPTFATYRLASPGGNVDGNLAFVLQKALDVHTQRYGHPPTRLVVNAALVGKAREALHRLGLRSLKVTTSGGCLAWELWAEVAPDG